MEVLHSIWNLLISQNEMVTKVICAPTVIIEAWLAFLLITSILKLDYTKKQKVLYIVFLSLLSLVIEFIIPTPYNVFINYFIVFIVIKKVLHTNNIKTILATILPTIVFALIGTLILKPILLIFNLSSEQAQHTPIYKLLYHLIMYITVWILYKIINSMNLDLLFKEDFTHKNKKIIIANLIFGFFTLGVQLTITAFYTDVLPVVITFLSFLSLLTYYFISLNSLTRTMKLQITTRNLETAESYNNSLSILYDNVKAFKHDFDNMVFTIGGFVSTDDMNGLKKYYNSLEKDCQRVNNIALLNPNLINNSGIYNLLTAKYQKAKNSKVEIELDFFFDFNALHMPIYDFSRMLGILIDNAIEAASETDEKIVKIMFRDSSNNRTQIIKIENSYKNKDVDKNKIFEKGVTGKENHSGMGLWEVKQIIKRNNNINLITEPNEKYFKQCLEIYY
jgi:two-component system sensor histidine kinase AgrC